MYVVDRTGWLTESPNGSGYAARFFGKPQTEKRENAKNKINPKVPLYHFLFLPYVPSKHPSLLFQ